jgi:tRNA A-37 threonylcarbamoyl transferase component Bud32
MMPMQRLEASWLPPGTVVGPWKVRAFQGAGAYGLVFRAVRAAREHGGWVALKVASQPGDARFKREAVLLSRQEHIGVPKLLGRGEWQSPEGARYPYLVMEWLEGVGLYEWAEQSKPSNEEQLWVVGQVARALESTHAVGGVHRDVKGDNVRVCFNGRRAVLMDFGAGIYLGAARLTREGLPPGTDAYRSPEAWRFALDLPRHSMERYEATPADDVFALGVSAYRMVTGAYPPPAQVSEEESGPGRVKWTKPVAPRELNPRVDAKLSAQIMRMLSERPEERPPAGELAWALEEATAVLRRARTSGASRFSPRRVLAWLQGHVPLWARYVACAVLGGVLATVVAWELRPEREGGNSTSRAPAGGVGWAGLGDTGAEDLGALVAPPRERGLAKPMPEEPLEGQRRAPHCRPPAEVTINEGCWMALRDVKPPCGELTYEWKGGCYVPTYSPPRRPTAEPP